jgi:Tfp pilus assembly protein PilO
MAKINIKLSPQQQKIIFGGAVGLIAGGFCYLHFFWSPLSDKIVAAEADITKAEDEIDTLQKVAAREPLLRKQLADLEQKAIDLEKRLPKKKSTPEILVTLSELADSYNVTLMSFTPGATNAKGGSPYFNELPYPLTVKGTYHNIGKFLAAVSLEQRIFNVQNVSYAEPGAESLQMMVTFTLISYQYKG